MKSQAFYTIGAFRCMKRVRIEVDERLAFRKLKKKKNLDIYKTLLFENSCYKRNCKRRETNKWLLSTNINLFIFIINEMRSDDDDDKRWWCSVLGNTLFCCWSFQILIWTIQVRRAFFRWFIHNRIIDH